MADAVHVRQSQDDQLEAVHALIGFDHEFFGDFRIAVCFARSAAKILVDWTGLSFAAIVDAEGANLHQAFDAGEAHGFRHIDGSHHVDLQTAVDRVGDFAADQSSGVDDRVAFMFLNGLDQRR